MSYGFANSKDPAGLPQTGKARTGTRADIEQAAKGGRALGFVPRGKAAGRKPGPKRSEPQGKLTVTGPERVLERLQAHSDAMGGVPYWQAIESLLDAAESGR